MHEHVDKSQTIIPIKNTYVGKSRKLKKQFT